MTDVTNPSGDVPAAIVCPIEGCHALVPDTLEDRREHRAGHRQDEKVGEALRRALRELRADFDKLRAETRKQVADLRKDVEGIDRTVGQIEIPEPVAPLTINRGGWDDDDEDDLARPGEDAWGVFAAEPLQPAVTTDDVEPDDFDDEPAVTPGLGASLYTPGTGPIA